MPAFKHILVATDFGEAAASAADTAVEIAARFESRLTLLHTTWLPTSAYASYSEGRYSPASDLARNDQAALDAEFDRIRMRYPTAASKIATGEAWETILVTAREIGADLIVLGTHGRRGLSRVFLGSIAEKVVRLSPVPVLTVSGRADREAKQRAMPMVLAPLPHRN
jgi:nucleotide-binding universal stress UspA family protein